MSELELVRFFKCPKCNFENKEGDLECGKCGIVFEGYVPEPEPVHPPEPISPGSLHHTHQRTTPTKRPFPVMPVVAFLVVASVLLYFGLSKPYVLVGPKPGAGPATVLMHGYGAPGEDLVGLAERIGAGAPNVTFLVLEAPHHQGMGRAWVSAGSKEGAIEDAEESRERILDAVADLEDAGVSSTNIYLGGFSQGSQIALQVVAGQPTGRKFAGAVLLSGGWPNWPRAVAPGGVGSENMSDSFRVLVAHGKSDNVVNHATSKQVVQSLVDNTPATVEFFEFNGGHQIPPEVVESVSLFLSNHRP